jgi:pyruvate dehydrogenase E1 component alpha subunit
VAKKGDAYGIANEFVDGMDVLAVRNAVARAVERGRNESLPTLLEIRTYRYMGHSMSDPGNYRTRDEITKYQERDPIKLFLESMTEAGFIGEEAFAEMETKAKAEVQRCVDFAENSPFPDEAELLTDVFA